MSSFKFFFKNYPCKTQLNHILFSHLLFIEFTKLNLFDKKIFFEQEIVHSFKKNMCRNLHLKNKVIFLLHGKRFFAI